MCLCGHPEEEHIGPNGWCRHLDEVRKQYLCLCVRFRRQAVWQEKPSDG